jgi:hypothetical protein
VATLNWLSERSTARTFRVLFLAWALAYAAAGADAGVPSAPDVQDPPAEQVPVVTRDADGRIRVRAIRLTAPLRIDGRLDEEVYQSNPAIDVFVQTLPAENGTPTERTEAWVLFDASTIYVTGRMWESASPGEWTANEVRRDTNQLRQNDNFGVVFDTFLDRRNGFMFYTNPLGALADYQLTDEGNPNADWNPVWDVRAGRFDGGWTVEMAIPFKSLRYHSGTNQSWGLQIRRSIRRKNEFSYLTPLPLSSGGSMGFFRVSAAATLTGLDLPPAGKNVEIKPYGISRLTTDRLATPVVSDEIDADFGIDAKYGITANLTADVTYNTDFAQVEVDEQQVNLTRFSLFFPEKREFFLEGRGVFDFGRGGSGLGGFSGPGSATALTPTLFYSRRIGLNSNRVVPIDVGGRVTGKIRDFGIGVLNIQTGDERLSATPSTNFSVVRLKRDVLLRSSVGAIFTNRSESSVATGSNQAYGVDSSFSFFEDLNLGGYLARTSTPGLRGDDLSYQGKFNYAGDRYGAQAEYLHVGDHFNPEVGFLRRNNFKRSFASIRFSPRPRSIDWVRQLTWEGNIEYIETGTGLLESRQQSGRFNVELENSDQFSVEAGRKYELLVAPFGVAPAVTIPTGGYTFGDVLLRYALGQQRRLSGTATFQQGHFYDGTITAVDFSGARFSVTDQWSVEPNISVTRVKLPYGSFTTRLLRTRSDYGFNPRMFISALLQYASADRVFSSNLRFRWEYRAGSELFIVYTDERDTLRPGYPDLRNRAFVVKVNRLFRF